MKNVLSALVLWWLCQPIQAQTNDLTVQITGLKSNAGKCIVALYNNPKGFPTETKSAVATITIAIKDGRCTAVFPGIAVGEYAVSVVHDENDNGKLDTNYIGIPKEGIGTSNNAKSSFGPPKYNDSKFQCSKLNNINIIINYL